MGGAPRRPGLGENDGKEREDWGGRGWGRGEETELAGGGDRAGDAPSLVFFFSTSQLRRRGVLSVSPACGETQQQAAGGRVGTLAAGGVVCVCVYTDTHTNTRAHIRENNVRLFSQFYLHCRVPGQLHWKLCGLFSVGDTARPR